MRINKINNYNCSFIERGAKKFICEQLRQSQGGDKNGQYQIMGKRRSRMHDQHRLWSVQWMWRMRRSLSYRSLRIGRWKVYCSKCRWMHRMLRLCWGMSNRCNRAQFMLNIVYYGYSTVNLERMIPPGGLLLLYSFFSFILMCSEDISLLVFLCKWFTSPINSEKFLNLHQYWCACPLCYIQILHLQGTSPRQFHSSQRAYKHIWKNRCS